MERKEELKSQKQDFDGVVRKEKTMKILQDKIADPESFAENGLLVAL
jgi:hypothetical protein